MAFEKLKSTTAIPRMPTMVAGTPTLNNSNMNTLNSRHACIMFANVTDSVDKIAFRIAGSAVSGTYQIRIETVDTSTGFPTGTLWAANTYYDLNIVAGDTNAIKEVTLNSPANVNLGDVFAVIIQAITANNGTLSITYADDSANGFPYYLSDTAAAGSWSLVTNGIPVLGVHYITNGYLTSDELIPISTNATLTYNTSTAGADCYGNRYNLPYDVKIKRVWVWGDFDGNAIVNIYAADGVTILASGVNGLNNPPTANASLNIITLNQEISISANTNFYVSLEPTTTTSLSTYYLDFLNSDVKTQYVDSSCQMAQAKDPSGVGSWTINAARIVTLGIILSEINIGGSAGGLLTHPGMAGGMRG